MLRLPDGLYRNAHFLSAFCDRKVQKSSIFLLTRQVFCEIMNLYYVGTSGAVGYTAWDNRYERNDHPS